MSSTTLSSNRSVKSLAAALEAKTPQGSFSNGQQLEPPVSLPTNVRVSPRKSWGFSTPQSSANSSNGTPTSQTPSSPAAKVEASPPPLLLAKKATPAEMDRQLSSGSGIWGDETEELVAAAAQQRLAEEKTRSPPKEPSAHLLSSSLSHSDVVQLDLATKASSIKADKDATFFVKVKNGVAHIVGDFGGARLYISTRFGDVCDTTKVWVLLYADAGREHLKSSLEPALLRLNEHLAPVVARVSAASATTKSKTLSVTAPVYAKLVNGVLHVQVTLGQSTVFIQEKASESWSKVSARASSSYSMAYGAMEARARPLWLSSCSKVSASKAAIWSVAQPYWVRAGNGALYVQAVIGNTLVRIQVASNERLLVPALAAYASLCGVVDKYTSPILAKVVSVFDNTKAQMHQLLAPYLEKGASMATYTRTKVNNMLVEVKVRVNTKLHSAQELLSVCYVKFQDGYVYIHGVVGDKVLYVKVSLAELTHRFATKVLELGSNAQIRALAAKDSVQGTAVAMVQSARSRGSALSSKAGVMVADRQVQVTAAGAVGGGATGLATGTIAGAVVGIVPAIFTFGLSIPLFATVGGAAGLCTGSLAGGATARSVHANQDGIKGGLVGVMSKASNGKEYLINTASGGKEYVSKKAKGCSDFMGERTLMVKARLGGTGGTAADSD